MNALTSLIALAAACLAATVVFELRPRPDAPAPAVRPSPAGAVPSAPAEDASAGRIALIDTLLGRPLFSHTRRPPDRTSAAPEPATPLPRMTAILIDGPRRSAIFVPPGGGKPVRVAEGGRLGPFTIESIGPQHVVVLGPEGKQIVRTSFDPNPPAPVPPLLAAPLVMPRFPGIILPVTPPGAAPGLGAPLIPPAASAGYGAAR